MKFLTTVAESKCFYIILVNLHFEITKYLFRQLSIKTFNIKLLVKSIDSEDELNWFI